MLSNDTGTDEDYRTNIGWFMVVIFMAILLIHTIVFLIEMMRTFCNFVNKCIAKNKQKKD